MHYWKEPISVFLHGFELRQSSFGGKPGRGTAFRFHLAWSHASAPSAGPAWLGPHCSLLTLHPHPCGRVLLWEMMGRKYKVAESLGQWPRCIYSRPGSPWGLLQLECHWSPNRWKEMLAASSSCCRPRIDFLDAEGDLQVGAALPAPSGLRMFSYCRQWKTEALEHHPVPGKSPFHAKGYIS